MELNEIRHKLFLKENGNKTKNGKRIDEESGWVFDEITLLQLSVLKTNPLLDGTHAKLPINSPAFLNGKYYEVFCALLSLLACRYPAKTLQESIGGYRQQFDRKDLEGSGFGWFKN